MKHDPEVENSWPLLDALTDGEIDTLHVRARRDWRYVGVGVAAFAALVVGSALGWSALVRISDLSAPIRFGILALLVVAICLVFFGINKVLYYLSFKRQVQLQSPAVKPD